MTQHRILIQLDDSKGLVYHISKIFYEHNLNIISNNEFVDREQNKFFMRTVVSGEINTNVLLGELKTKLPKHATVNVTPKKNHDVIIFATKEAHALGDLLIRHEDGELDANILAVVSNHDSLKTLVEKFNLPYHTVSAEGLSKAEHEAKIFELLDQYENIDYLVLAKYMRILSPDFVSRYKNKIINIHHSFLPAFIGANPYKQAYDRGVKIIGATAHYVTDDLDEGPIIAQDTIHVDHAHSWKDMQALGRNVEKVVLANALKLLFEDRVFLHGNKTVIL